jgi:hypothetical protein
MAPVRTATRLAPLSPFASVLNGHAASGKREAVKRKVVRKRLPDEGFLNMLGAMGLAKRSGVKLETEKLGNVQAASAVETEFKEVDSNCRVCKDCTITIDTLTLENLIGFQLEGRIIAAVLTGLRILSVCGSSSPQALPYAKTT